MVRLDLADCFTKSEMESGSSGRRTLPQTLGENVWPPVLAEYDFATALPYVDLIYEDRGEGCRQRVYVVAMTCKPFGGRRWAFLCPISAHLARKLYFVPGRGYGSRYGLDLAYAVEAEGRGARYVRRQRKLAAKLDDGEGRPKGMHWKTYQRILSELD